MENENESQAVLEIKESYKKKRINNAILCSFVAIPGVPITINSALASLANDDISSALIKSGVLLSSAICVGLGFKLHKSSEKSAIAHATTPDIYDSLAEDKANGYARYKEAGTDV